MTHFATADDPDIAGPDGSDAFEWQLASFNGLVDYARDRFAELVVHAANSAATLRDPRAHFNAVRCGVATYGLSPTQGDPAADDLQPVMRVTSHVAELRARSEGDSTGYSRTWVSSGPSRVALVPIGYADGIRRALSNRGHALVRGAPRQVVGNVSMDHLSLLVASDVEVGDEVVLLGTQADAQVRAEDHAEWAETINYEITCGIAREPRLARVFAE
jgi:alanine racemase